MAWSCKNGLCCEKILYNINIIFMTCALYHKNFDFICVRLDTSQYMRKGTSHAIVKFDMIIVTSH